MILPRGNVHPSKRRRFRAYQGPTSRRLTGYLAEGILSWPRKAKASSGTDQTKFFEMNHAEQEASS